MAKLPNNLQAGPGDDVIVGTSGSDHIDGFGGNDTISGLAGDDFLFGWTGNDVTDGGEGNDWIFGEGDTDNLTGGPGYDIFGEYDQWLNGDTITDFSIGDVILIRDADISTFTFSLVGSTLTFTGAPMPGFTGGTMTLLGATGSVLAASAFHEGGVQIRMIVGPAQGQRVRDDFNGDDRSDILWRNENGLVTNWLAADGAGFVSNWSHVNVSVPLSWTIVGTGDFDGDDHSDILWRNDLGHVTNWLGGDGGAFTFNWANASIGVPLDWSVEGTGDFNGDGHDDVLWRNSAGVVTNWLGTESGGFVSNWAHASGAAGPEWQIAGVGDFDGDHHADILWQNWDGFITQWRGTDDGGFDPTGVFFFMRAGISGIGDFNGDGRSDLIILDDWSFYSTMLADLGGNLVFTDLPYIGDASSGWLINQTGDFNGDGADDLLWRNQNGAVDYSLGQLDGTFVENGIVWGSVPTSWHIQSEWA